MSALILLICRLLLLFEESLKYINVFICYWIDELLIINVYLVVVHLYSCLEIG